MSDCVKQKKTIKMEPNSYCLQTEYTQPNNYRRTQNFHFSPEIFPSQSRNRVLTSQSSKNSINPKNLKTTTCFIKSNRNNSVKLPLLINKNEECSFYKMKKYTVPIPKIKRPKKIVIKIEEKKNEKKKEKKSDDDTDSENSDEKESSKSEKENSSKNEEEEKVMSFNQYLIMQSKAEARLRPRIGDTSLDLVNYIKKVGIIRKRVMKNIIEELNKTENRFNNERPKVDSKFRSKEKLLVDNRWKNSFSLEQYQKFFSRNMKGKISSMNYTLMLKRFRQIAMMCFAEGNINLGAIKRSNYIE